ncbi:5'-methylthioadenosine/S-adenosylhomocysteine nucleosidase [Novosphingobium mangrovi (ex Huang et al. 2023)]|uniref:5'-methylthioadenosine/S-adenosylhomocysteine nucleosidase n=1 Tax=Novosphingobium mangrovi (ex Huang et al. 2023) TaxID=2976432 RepID=A0ABT2I2F6_9SPHN|nr:5'-methylthioadenosine/S-adenosylhomocysteine nucleosidase [Novosphingobium mangrovi (ex Huang et al. 2023)]MCT2398984.1 5'-methylthioadenosine/S-adenosylhomocysteine nucleosidase [Novosphingobium mangrovi (ex Huang et al. 2023)]
MRRIVLGLAALFAFIACPALAEELDSTPRTLVMTAYYPEWNALVHAVTDAKEYKLNGGTYLTGTLEGKPVLLMQSGVSMVNAAMNTQLVLDHFAVKRIVFSGIAGGVDPSLTIGDVIVAEDWGQYLEVNFARQTQDGWLSPEPVDPKAPANWNFMYPRGTRVGNADTAPGRHYTFRMDPELLAVAREIAPKVVMERCVPPSPQQLPDTELCLHEAPRIVVGGTGVSAGVFADNAQFREYLHAAWNARVLDMESAAVAQVAYANEVPTIIFRSLSDLAGGDKEKNMEDTFEHLASVNSAHVVRAFLAALPD